VTAYGIDPSTKRIGLAHPDGATTSITARAGADDPIRRRHELRAGVRRELRLWPEARLAVVEGYGLGSPGRLSLVRLGEVGGAVRDEAFELGLEVVEVPPSVLKLAATGKGNASKDEVLEAARAAGSTARNHDEADAWWLHELGRRWLADEPLPDSVAVLPWPAHLRRQETPT
jgi:Holliday junction resolvasome RuvABC endonuclease subunit